MCTLAVLDEWVSVMRRQAVADDALSLTEPLEKIFNEKWIKKQRYLQISMNVLRIEGI